MWQAKKRINYGNVPFLFEFFRQGLQAFYHYSGSLAFNMNYSPLRPQTVLDTATKLVRVLPEIQQALFNVKVQFKETLTLLKLMNSERQKQLRMLIKNPGLVGPADARMTVPQEVDIIAHSEWLKEAESSMHSAALVIGEYNNFDKAVKQLRDQVSREAEKLEEEVKTATKVERRMLRKRKLKEMKWRVHFDRKLKDSDSQETPFPTAVTPRAYEERMERIRFTEKLRTEIRDICWSSTFLDYLPRDVTNFGSNTAAEVFYKSLLFDRQAREQLPHGQKNKLLRWTIMSKMWEFVHQEVLCRPQEYRTPEILNDIAKDMQVFFAPYCRPAAVGDKFRKQLLELVCKANRVASVIESDETARYSFRNPRLLHSNNRLSLVKDNVNVAAVQGANHDDDSRDVVRLVVFGGLVRKNHRGKLPRRNVVETKPYVVVYRPEVDEVVVDEEEVRKGQVQSSKPVRDKWYRVGADFEILNRLPRTAVLRQMRKMWRRERAHPY